MNLLDLATRVKRGAKLLDRKFPGWRRVLRNHEDTFNLKDVECCVLGTIEHHVGRARVLARRKLGRHYREDNDGYTALTDVLNIKASEYGFNAPHQATEGADAEFTTLSDLWRAEFREGR